MPRLRRAVSASRSSAVQATAYPETKSQINSVPITPESMKRLYFNKPPTQDVWNRTRFGRGLNMDRIETALRGAQYGAMRDLCDLARETVATDPHLAAILQKRINAVAALPFDIVAADGPGVDPKKAEANAELVRVQIGRIPHFRQALKQLAWGLFDGRAALEIQWLMRPSDQAAKTGGPYAEPKLDWVAADLLWIHPRRLQFGPVRELRIYDQMSTTGFQAVGVALNDFPFKFVEFKPQLFGDYPELEGLAPRCLYWSFFKRFGQRDRMQLLELFGKPWRIVEVAEDAQVDPVDLQDAELAADALGATNTARMPRGVNLRVEAPGESAGEIHADVIAESDKQNSKLVLGQTGTTDAQNSGLGSNQPQVMAAEQLLILQGDAELLGDAVEDGLCDAIVALNRGIGELINAPRFLLRAEVPTDRTKEAQRVKAALDAGIVLAADEVYEVTGFRKPTPQDVTIQMQVDGLTVRPVMKAAIEAADAEFGTGDQPVVVPEPAPSAPAAPALPKPEEPNAAPVTPPVESEPPANLPAPLKIASSIRAALPNETDVAEATEPMFAIAQRVEALVDHMPGMKGEQGLVSIAHAGAPPYYGVTFDGTTEVHKWLSEDELKAVAKPDAGEPKDNPGAMPMDINATSARYEQQLVLEARGTSVCAPGPEHDHAAHVTLAVNVQPDTVHGTLDTIIQKGVRECSRITGGWADKYCAAVRGLTSAAAINRAIAKAHAALELNGYARAFERRVTHGLMTGSLDSAWEGANEDQIKPEAFPAPEVAAARVGLAFKDLVTPEVVEVEPSFTEKAYASALKYFNEKQPIPKSLFSRLSASMKARSFTVAGLTSDASLETAHQELARALVDGSDLKDFSTRLAARFEDAGLTALNPSHAENVFRTNLMDCYNIGRRAEMSQPTVLKQRPYWLIRGVPDNRQRPNHRAVNGWCLRADDPFFAKGGPPWSWNCRCRLTAIREARAQAIGVRSGAEIRDLPDEGFTPSAMIGPDLLGLISG